MIRIYGEYLHRLAGKRTDVAAWITGACLFAAFLPASYAMSARQTPGSDENNQVIVAIFKSRQLTHKLTADKHIRQTGKTAGSLTLQQALAEARREIHQPITPEKSATPPASCFDLAGNDAKIDPDLLRAIAWQESGFNPGATGKNFGSIDIGLMQINSQHLPLMASYGIYRQQLYNDVCTNIYSGAYILASAFNKWGTNWLAVGAYNAGFALTHRQQQRRMAYARQVYTLYRRIKNHQAEIKTQKTAANDF